MPSSLVNLKSYLIPYAEIIDATKNFSHQIGSGGFGTVYKGQLSSRWQNRIAAFKRLDHGSHQGNAEFRKELEMISEFHHDNVISFIGYCDQNNEMIIVCEYASNSSLDHHLENPQKRCLITWTQRLKICLDVARALNYLHSGFGQHTRVIHRDIKSANILLDDKFVAKVSDFGLSKIGTRNEANTQINTRVAGTASYTDPAYIETGILTKESDVYSFGVVLFEMLSGMLVYLTTTSIDGDKPKHLKALVREYYQDGTPEKLIDPDIENQICGHSFNKFKDIAYQCFALDGSKRPTMKMVVAEIGEALDLQLRVNFARLIEFVMKDNRFDHCKPVAAFIIYKSLLHWKCLESGRTSCVFVPLIEILSHKFDEDKHDYVPLAGWLSFATTLLFLTIQKSLNLEGATSAETTPPPALLPEHGSSPSSIVVEVDAEAEADAALQPIEAKYPFKKQLTTYAEKIYCTIRENIKKELKSLLDSCIEAPPTWEGVIRSGQSFGIHSQHNDWKEIVDRLDAHLNILKKNYVSPSIVQKIFVQIFSHINVQLLNCLLERCELHSYNNGEYVKVGLAMLKLWCCHAQEYAALASDELEHIRQAVDFMVIKNNKISIEEITSVICPMLNILQLRQLCSMYRDDTNLTHELPSHVTFEINRMVIDTKATTTNSLLLEDSSSVPSFDNGITTSLHVEDFLNIIDDKELTTYHSFHFWHN